MPARRRAPPPRAAATRAHLCPAAPRALAVAVAPAPTALSSPLRSRTPPAAASSTSDTQLASTLAGVLSRVLLHPIDCIKTRLQHIRSQPNAPPPHKVVAKFVAAEGPRGLYRGIIGALAGVVPYSMLYMPSYELAQATLITHAKGRELLGLRHVLAGAFAGVCGSLVKVPVDVVKKRLQAGLYPNLVVALSSIALSNGRPSPSPFYAGLTSSIMYDIPYNAVQFTVLENVKRVSAARAPGLVKGSPVENVFIGALTGMFTSLLTEPLDVVKTRMMTQRALGVRTGVTVYRGWIHCVRTIAAEEGVAALWKGTLPRLVLVAASSAIWYGSYQTFKQRIRRRRETRAIALTRVQR